MKKIHFLTLLTLVFMLYFITTVSAVNDTREIQVLIDGEPIFFDVLPTTVNNRTMVPLRAIFEGLGATVKWDETTKTITSSKDSIEISLTIDNNTLNVNGTSVTLDVPAMLLSNRTFVPVRAISEAFGCDVKWLENSRTVSIITKGTKDELSLNNISLELCNLKPYTIITSENFLNVNSTDVIQGKDIDINGNIIDSDTYAITGYIPVIPGKTFTFYRNDGGAFKPFQMRRVFAYDSEKKLIEGSRGLYVTNYTIPENAEFIQVSIASVYFTEPERYKPMFIYGTPKPVDRYIPYIKADSLDILLKSDNIIDLSETLNEAYDEEYKAPIVPSVCNNYNTITEYIEPPSSDTLSSTYNLYDELVEKYPDYVTKSLLGNVTVDGIDLPVYRYDFTPPSVTGSKMNDVSKILLTTGVHGTEKSQIPICYRLMLDICENWRANELLQNLRFYCHFTVIPIVNPYGYLNMTRKNENGVDIARNFDIDFKIRENKNATDYGGQSPNSEQSTKLITSLANSEHFDFVLDIHTFGSYTSGGNKIGYITPCLKRPADVAFGRAFALWANSKLLKDNPNIKELEVGHFHSMEMGNFDGYLSGIFPNGMTIELSSSWGAPYLGEDELAQKTSVELLGSAIMTAIIGFNTDY